MFRTLFGTHAGRASCHALHVDGLLVLLTRTRHPATAQTFTRKQNHSRGACMCSLPVWLRETFAHVCSPPLVHARQVKHVAPGRAKAQGLVFFAGSEDSKAHFLHQKLQFSARVWCPKSTTLGRPSGQRKRGCHFWRRK